MNYSFNDPRALSGNNVIDVEHVGKVLRSMLTISITFPAGELPALSPISMASLQKKELEVYFEV